jgi:hypothetical protein
MLALRIDSHMPATVTPIPTPECIGSRLSRTALRTATSSDALRARIAALADARARLTYAVCAVQFQAAHCTRREWQCTHPLEDPPYAPDCVQGCLFTFGEPGMEAGVAGDGTPVASFAQ